MGARRRVVLGPFEEAYAGHAPTWTAGTYFRDVEYLTNALLWIAGVTGTVMMQGWRVAVSPWAQEERVSVGLANLEPVVLCTPAVPVALTTTWLCLPIGVYASTPDPAAQNMGLGSVRIDLLVENGESASIRYYISGQHHG